jgi:hypothetical protein
LLNLFIVPIAPTVTVEDIVSEESDEDEEIIYPPSASKQILEVTQHASANVSKQIVTRSSSRKVDKQSIEPALVNLPLNRRCVSHFVMNMKWKLCYQNVSTQNSIKQSI